MAGSAVRLKLRLFLEGMEVPVIAATVQASPNSPAACSLQIPPTVEGTKLLPRTLVHLFFLDGQFGPSPTVSQRGASVPNPQGEQRPTAYEQGIHAASVSAEDIANNTRNEQYKLLFGGEVTGFQWSKSPNSRSLVLQCLDFSNYWDYAFQWQNTDLFGPGYKALFSGGATNLFTDFLAGEGEAILKLIRTPSELYPELKGLLGGIVHLLEAIGGVYHKGKKFSGQNSFFTIAELRLRITQMITAYESDPTAKQLIGADQFGSLFGRTLGGLGQQVSFRQAINALQGMIFHETYPIPTPRFVPGSAQSFDKSAKQSVKDNPKTSFLTDAADSLMLSIASLRGNMSVSESEAEALKNLGPSFKGKSDIRSDSVIAQLRTMQKLLGETINKTKNDDVAGSKKIFTTTSAALRAAAGFAKGWRIGATPTIQSKIFKQFDIAHAQLRKVATLTTKQIPLHVAPRLNQHIFRPDVWFAAPPRCNVLFPEHYTSLSYARSFLQEPTRLLLKTNSEFFGEDMLFDQFYFAPKAITTKAERDTLQAMLKNELLDHELFTGILPVFEKMGELNIFAARSGTVEGKTPKVGLAQRSANFLYFKYRFAARQMQVSAKFNPYVVPGFPGLIIDKYVDPDTLSRRAALQNKDPEALRELASGTHFLGNFTEVTHTLDQRNGRTDINCSYPRQPEESVEFLGVKKEDQMVSKRLDKDALRATVVAATEPPKHLSLGPNYGVITGVEEVTAAYKGANFESAKLLPIYQGKRRKGIGAPAASAPVGWVAPAKSYGTAVVKLFGSSTQMLSFKAYRVKEEVPRYRREQIAMAFEDLIQPGWYGDCWRASQVGKIYEQFFAIGAITDPTQVADSDGVSSGFQNTDAADALAIAATAKSGLGHAFEDARTFAPALLSLQEKATIQQSVEFLVQVYSYIRSGGLDVEEYIRAYTWRPIASLIDMFGTSDLKLDKDGIKVVQGIEGFHSRAFSDHTGLFGLTSEDLQEIIGLKSGDAASARMDTRARKRAAVRQMLFALHSSGAVLA